VGGCFPTEGDFAILELVEVKKRYPIVKINAVPYLVEAVHRYFKEAEGRGCVVDEGLKRYVAERIRSLLEKHGVDLRTMLTYDLHGVNKDVLDVLKMLGLEQAPPPRPTAAPHLPVPKKSRAAVSAPPPPPPSPQSAKPILPPPMPPRGYKPPQRRRNGVDISFALKFFAFVAAVIVAAVGLPMLYLIVFEHATITPTFANTLDDPAVRVAFETLNRYRVENGLPPLEFITLKTPLFRAEYIYNHSRMRHYDVEGRHPNYYYTLLDGGVYAVEENLAKTMCGPCIARDVVKQIYAMVYDDWLSLWGHRDSLLDPCNNKVSIAVARDFNTIYTVVYMVAVWANWIEPPRYYNGTFSFKGYVYLPPRGNFYEIFIYRDVPSPLKYDDVSYNIGEPYAAVLPPTVSIEYLNVTNIRADRYVLRREGDRWYVDVAFRFEPPDNALYTVVMFANSTGVKWEPKSPWGWDRLRRCEIFEYTIG